MSSPRPGPRHELRQRRWRITGAQGISLLVHLAVIVPAGIWWEWAEPEPEPPPEEEIVEVVALAPERWEENRLTRAERQAEADRQVEEETTARRRAPRPERTRVPGLREVAVAAPAAPAALEADPVVRSESASSAPVEPGLVAEPVADLAAEVVPEPIVASPAELARALEEQPTYTAVASRSLPEIAPRDERALAPAPRERIAELPSFSSLASRHPEMTSEASPSPVFLLADRGEASAELEARASGAASEAVTRRPAPSRRPHRDASTSGTSSALATTSAGNPDEAGLVLGGGDRFENAKEAAESRATTERNLLYAYLLRVRDAVEPLWMPLPIVRAALRRAPRAFPGDHIELRVHLELDGEGQVRRAELARTSGIPELDRHALEAVARAAPFLPPPERLLDQSGSIGFTYGARTYLSAGAGGP